MSEVQVLEREEVLTQEQLDEKLFDQPAITWLNFGGDVTVSFDERNKEQILDLVKKKMGEGYSFFVLIPQDDGEDKKVKLSRWNRKRAFNKAHAIVVPDEQLTALLKSGAAELTAGPSKENAAIGRRLTKAEDVVKERRSAALRPVFGG